MFKREIVIGDVHGCTSEMMMLLDLLQPTPKDCLIWAGDLVDKGPDSAGAVKIARHLSATIPTILVEGNHENKHRRFRKHMSDDAPDRAFALKGAEEIHKITQRLYPEDVEFLDNAVLYTKLTNQNYLVTHGGVSFALNSLPPANMQELMSHPKKKWFLNMLRLRYVDPKGNMVALHKETPNDKFWADVYDGKFGKVFFGHQPFTTLDTPKEFPHATALDLGCVFGNKLAAAIVTNTTVEYVTVQAKAKYAKEHSEE